MLSAHRVALLVSSSVTFLSAVPAMAQTAFHTGTLYAQDWNSDQNFAQSMAASGGVVVVGAWQDDENGARAGAAYVIDAATGAILRKLMPTDGAANDLFGISVDTDGTVALVGALGKSDNGPSSGAAYLFDLATGIQLEKFLPADIATQDQFGSSVAISGTHGIVGARYADGNVVDSGAAYVFDLTDGSQIARLEASDGAIADDFGFSVDLDGDTAAVGAPQHGATIEFFGSGAVYLFNAQTGAQLEKLEPSDVMLEDEFGSCVMIDGGRVYAGAPYHELPGVDDGAAYVFDMSDSSEIAKLVPVEAPGASGDFGASMCLSADELIIGTRSGPGTVSGAVYRFDRGTLALLSNVEADQAGLLVGDGFGNSVAVASDRLFVGAPLSDERTFRNGAVYVFSSSESCPGDCDGSGTVDFNDLVAVIARFGETAYFGCETEPSGAIDFNDLVATLGLFGPCPE